jgi:heme/copper-type cytochrome/quinol oxidase subunit 4
LIQIAGAETIFRDILSSAYYYLTLDLGFLLLILIGGLLAWRHGRLALLLPLGYLIPTIVLGRFDYDPAMPFLLAGISIAVFVYRIFITLVAPIWIVRSASDRARRRAGTIGLLAAIGILVAVHIGYWLANAATYGWEMDLFNFYSYLSPELITLAGIVLAVSLYKADTPAQSAIQPSPVSAGAIEG